jgi:hypothetical protein
VRFIIENFYGKFWTGDYFGNRTDARIYTLNELPEKLECKANGEQVVAELEIMEYNPSVPVIKAKYYIRIDGKGLRRLRSEAVAIVRYDT